MGVLQRALGTGWLGDGHGVSRVLRPALQGSEPHEPWSCPLSPLSGPLFMYLTFTEHVWSVVRAGRQP